MDSYYRYFAWSLVNPPVLLLMIRYDIAPRRTIEPIFKHVYADESTPKMPAQRLGLLFGIFAMGALHNLEVPPDDSAAGEYMQVAKTCLVKGDFMTKNTIAGVQTLVCHSIRSSTSS